MEDILASIRRILSEDEAAAPDPAPAPPAAAPPPPPPPPPRDSDVLTLDESMLVAEPEPALPEPAPPEPFRPDPVPPEPFRPEPFRPEPAPLPDLEAAFQPIGEGLVAPEAIAEAASSVNTLMRTLAGHQSMAVYRGGPTLEDIVREEMRPMLKSWLDQNLPPLVERLVRAEIDRVVGRATS